MFASIRRAIYDFVRHVRIARAAREADEIPGPWYITQSDGPSHIPLLQPMRESEALVAFRQLFPTGQLDFIDREWRVIFYRTNRPRD